MTEFVSPINGNARFWNKVRVSTGCWEWQAHTRDGYGRFNIKGKFPGAHRLVLEYHLGRRLADGMLCMHSCDNRKCVRPGHLREGTFDENMADMAMKGRARVRRGEANIKQAKLTEVIVREIRASSDLQRVLAERHGVAPSLISMIRSRKAWPHVADEAQP